MTDSRISPPDLQVPRKVESEVERDCRERWQWAGLLLKVRRYRGDDTPRTPGVIEDSDSPESLR